MNVVTSGMLADSKPPKGVILTHDTVSVTTTKQLTTNNNNSTAISQVGKHWELTIVDNLRYKPHVCGDHNAPNTV